MHLGKELINDRLFPSIETKFLSGPLLVETFLPEHIVYRDILLEVLLELVFVDRLVRYTIVYLPLFFDLIVPTRH